MRLSFNLSQLSLAGGALIAGLLFYTQARPPTITHDLGIWLPTIPIDIAFPALLVDCLPSTLHGFAFVLLTAAVLDCRRLKALLAIGAIWFAIEAMFEFLQHPAIGASVLPEDLISVLGRGRFDWFDLIAAFIGCAVAVPTANLVHDPRRAAAKLQQHRRPRITLADHQLTLSSPSHKAKHL